ncbi:DUF502 domain-containing protein [Polluticaenibacter yanchengensis]|uniref:DUF502 domain-containing protein n=1 Tax=Polluticaenibacter yanchengensis TaxID=3014562 RepID=A0ABT4UKH3_9BACT|nr:DUF502 domain-containing protein [Chitinophagaceae bacterium LY-5]
MKKVNSLGARIFQYFMQGVLLLAPVFITGWFIYSVFQWLDNLIPLKFKLQGKENIYLPGLGVVIILIVITVAGYVSSFFLISKLLSFFDHLLEKTPGVKIIYGFVKDFSEAFGGKKRKFTKPVLVSIYQDDVYQVGFITNEDLKEFDLLEHVSVYIPNSYAVAGNLFLVKRARVKALDHVSPTDAMKFAISGGVADVE